MHTCVACKACKSECPASVDMAALKTAWQEQKWKETRPSPRTRLFAHLPAVARRVAGPLAHVANRVNGSALVRRQLEALGIAPQRALPPFATRPFSERDRPAPDASRPLDPDAPRVALFADTFGRFQEPAVPRAALKVFQAAGARVEVPEYRCCGRTYLSKGFVPHATRLARQLVETYAPYAEAGVAVVGLEPSCILTLRDEIPRLLDGDARALAVAEAAQTFEEWCAEHAGRLAVLDWRTPAGASGPGARPRALPPEGAVLDVRQPGVPGRGGVRGGGDRGRVLRRRRGVRLRGRALRPVDRDCGGPPRAGRPRGAGGEHGGGAGTSCREQIEHTTGRRALHPAEALAARLR